MQIEKREPKFSYEILRRASDGKLAMLQASGTTTVLPGDVVRIKVVRQE